METCCATSGTCGGSTARSVREKLAARLELDLSRRIKELSRGNRQKVGIVQAFMHEPDLLVLDEPTSGLDPLVQETFYELVAEATGRGGPSSCRRTCSPRSSTWPTASG